jgi:hypothetical protein
VQLVFKIGIWVIVTRLTIFLVGFLAIKLFRNANFDFFSSMGLLWNKWDANHYLNIADHWYQNQGEERFFIVFYPLYPFLIRIVNIVFHNTIFSGFFVSGFSLLVSCYYIHRLVAQDFDSQLAWDAVKYVLIFPMSFFLGLVFSDSLFLALSVMTIYYLRRQKWRTMGICGGLAALTRNFGLLLLLPVLIEYLQAQGLAGKWKSSRFGEWGKDFLRSGVYMFLIPAGTLVYLIINKLVTGDWFRFLSYLSEHWNQRFGYFPDNIKNYCINASIWRPADQVALWIPQIVAVVLVILLIFYAMHKIRLSYIAYAFGYIFLCASSTWLLSAPRYLLGLFPLYLLIALLSRRRSLDVLLTFVSIILLCFYTIAFIMDFNVM